MWLPALLLAPLVLLLHCTVSRACGITTHIEIANRALHFWNNAPDLKALALKHQDAYQAGNPYPDAMYETHCLTVVDVNRMRAC